MNSELLIILVSISIIIILWMLINLYYKRKKESHEKRKFYEYIDNKEESQEFYKLLSVNSIEDLLDKHAIYPWEDVISSKVIELTDKKVVVYFRSSGSSWANLAGRAGPLTICRITKQQINFFCEIMS